MAAQLRPVIMETTTQPTDATHPMTEAILRQVPLLISLPPDEIQFLARTLRPLTAAPNTLLFREAERGDRFYIVLDGQIEIIKALGTSDERLIGVRGPGEYVGEMSLFNRDGLRTASARTSVHASAHLFEMTRADFDALLHRQPSLAYEMVRVLSERLGEAHTKTVRDLRAKNVQLTEAYQSLQAAQAQIIEKEKLQRELQVAHHVQASLIPRATPRLEGWDFAARWQPARDVSGDFYDFIPLPRTQADTPECGIVVADVADKGMPAALLMAVSRSIVRASVTGMRVPADAIGQANRLICADSPQDLFVTLFYAQLDPLTGDMLYVNAGHTPAWLQRAGDQGWIELTRTGLPLGIYRHQTLQQRSIRMEPGDLLFLYTDGVLDATDPHGQAFGVERLRRLVLEHRQASAAHLASALDEALTTFRAGQPLFDDITYVIVKRPPGAVAHTTAHTLNLTADLHHLTTIRRFIEQAATALGAPPKTTDDLVLAVDELATNIINHGYRGRPNPIEIVVRREAGAIVVQLRDEAPPFDPTRIAEPDTTLPLHLRPVGGLGIFLARRLTDALTYRRIGDYQNEITLTKIISSTSEASHEHQQ